MEIDNSLMHLEITREEFAKFIDVDIRTVRRWALSETKIPKTIVLLLEAWIKLKSIRYRPDPLI